MLLPALVVGVVEEPNKSSSWLPVALAVVADFCPSAVPKYPEAPLFFTGWGSGFLVVELKKSSNGDCAGLLGAGCATGLEPKMSSKGDAAGFIPAGFEPPKKSSRAFEGCVGCVDFVAVFVLDPNRSRPMRSWFPFPAKGDEI